MFIVEKASYKTLIGILNKIKEGTFKTSSSLPFVQLSIEKELNKRKEARIEFYKNKKNKINTTEQITNLIWNKYFIKFKVNKNTNIWTLKLEENYKNKITHDDVIKPIMSELYLKVKK